MENKLNETLGSKIQEVRIGFDICEVIHPEDVKTYLNKFIEGIRTNPGGYMQETGGGRIVIADWEKLKILELKIFGEEFL